MKRISIQRTGFESIIAVFRGPKPLMGNTMEISEVVIILKKGAKKNQNKYSNGIVNSRSKAHKIY
jgi:hypothetical protein